MGVFGHDTQML
jgi:hypothetical protein